MKPAAAGAMLNCEVMTTVSPSLSGLSDSWNCAPSATGAL